MQYVEMWYTNSVPRIIYTGCYFNACLTMNCNVHVIFV